MAQLSSFHFQVKYRPRSNQSADLLSRSDRTEGLVCLSQGRDGRSRLAEPEGGTGAPDWKILQEEDPHLRALAERVRQGRMPDACDRREAPLEERRWWREWGQSGYYKETVGNLPCLPGPYVSKSDRSSFVVGSSGLGWVMMCTVC